MSAARIAALAAALALLPAAARAGAVGPLTTFTAGTPARAAEVNGNFAAVRTAVDDNAAQIAALTATVQAMQAQLQAHEDAFITTSDVITTLNFSVAAIMDGEAVQGNAIGALTNTVDAQAETIRSLTARLAAAEAQAASSQARLAAAEALLDTTRAGLADVQASGVLALAPYLVVFPGPAPLIRFHGANVQVVNDGGATQVVNGLGNLIIGYDEVFLHSPSCSVGAHLDQATCEASGATWAASHKSGSHNVVIGGFNSYSRHSGLVVGQQNTISGDYATVTGGHGNTSAGFATSVSGGYSNWAYGTDTSVSGGAANTASGAYGSVSGGEFNLASGFAGSVSGGRQNQAGGGHASVCGGDQNLVTGFASTISGGARNTARFSWASVTGGTDNTAYAQASTVTGGAGNLAEGPSAVVVGGALNTASGMYSVVVGGGNGQPSGGNRTNVGYTTILGGVSQTANVEGQTVPALP